MGSVFEITDGSLVSIDGKEARGAKGTGDPLTLVSAWVSANGDKLCLGQVATDKKSNEITAIPRLLEILDLRGCLVTIDAIGCQKGIVSKLHKKGCDYTIALKANQPELYDSVVQLLSEDVQAMNIPVETLVTDEKNRGRSERRSYTLCSEVSYLPSKKDWAGLSGVGMVETTRTDKGKTTSEKRYYIASYGSDIKRFAESVRGHWGIENELHWVLDVCYSEDASRIGSRNAAQNLSLMRKISINCFRKFNKKKLSFKQMRKMAGWDNDFMQKTLLNQEF
jgi:predicted transposase YbfD/YdcC